MIEKFKNWWSDFKKFDWWMFLALCLLALVPTIYQTVITRLITEHTNPGALDILGQMEWFDLIDETICAFLIVPMYSILSKAKKRENFNQRVFKLGIIVVALYTVFSIGTFFYGVTMVSFMNPGEIDCNQVIQGKLGDYLTKIFSIMKYLGIVLCVGMTIYDFVKALLDSDKEIMNKLVKKAFTRLILVAVLFFLPTFVNLIINLFVDNPCEIKF